MNLAEGLEYSLTRYRDSNVHLLKVDLTKRSIRPVMGAEAFPILRVYPVFEAIEQGALASVGGGFNVVWAHGLGYADQPLHALVVDREIWTTGSGAGGYGVLYGEHHISARQNRISVAIWRPDGTPFGIDRINRGHDGRISAFTLRGGTNQRPVAGHHYVELAQPGWWTPADHGQAQRRTMVATQVGTDLLLPEGDSVILQARWPLKLHIGDEVSWSQRLGGHNIRYLTSGWPQIVRGGVNVVPELEMDPTAPAGPDNWFVRPNPRMVIGASKNGRTAYMVTVEGRTEASEGLRLKELATHLIHEGIYSAVNFDGGGSAYMWTEAQGLVADSTYGDGTLEGLRPDHYAQAVF